MMLMNSKDNHLRKKICYEIALMKCNKSLTHRSKFASAVFDGKYIKLNDLDIHCFMKNHFLFVFHDMEEELIYKWKYLLLTSHWYPFKKMQIYAGIGSSVHTP